MRIPEFFRTRLANWAKQKINTQNPSVVIGDEGRDYLRRWHIIPRNRWFNIYLHQFLRSDDDRALHDHPWLNCSILLLGNYIEHIEYRSTGHHAALRGLCGMSAVWIEQFPRWEGHFYLRRAKAAHRVELIKEFHLDHVTYDGGRNYSLEHPYNEKPVITLFITGPKIREWGFHCPKGWVHWEKFVANSGGRSAIGRGCE